MSDDVYRRLARHLDTLPSGFPPTRSGVELRILQRLFTPEEAEVASHLTLIPEEARVVARRCGLPLDETTRRLEALEAKRVITTSARPGRPTRYAASQFVIGFWEGQVDWLTPELVRDFQEYHGEAFDPAQWGKVPQLRTVPVSVSLDARSEVMPYERVESLVRAHDRFAVSNCICRQEMHLAGHGCDRPMESCLQFGSAADSVVRDGRGRRISLDETLAILARAEEAGLVLQPANARDALFLCTCCGCCCGVFRALTRHPTPGSLVASAFRAALDPATCEGCGACETRCPMEAVAVQDGCAVLDEDRCIGCGLCVSTCPSGSLTLARRPEAEQPTIPRNVVDTYLQVGRARGRYGLVELAGLQVRSVVDRILSRG